MKLRYRVLLYFGGITALLALGLHAVLSRHVMHEYVQMERQSVARDMERVQQAFEAMLYNLHIKTADWASWDDTYQYMQDRNREYAQSNLIPETLNNLNVDLILLTNRDMKVFDARVIQRFPGQEAPEPAEALAQIPVRRLQSCVRKEHGYSAVINMKSTPMLISVRPILTSANKGPHRGWLIFGMYFERSAVSRMAKRTRLSVQARAVDHPQATDMDRRAWAALSAGAPVYVQALDEQEICGYWMIRDLNKRPLRMLQITQPRVIYSHGQESLQRLLFLVFGAAALFCGITFLLIEMAVLRRLSHLGAQVTGIQMAHDYHRRVFLTGRDELVDLAGQINNMLSTIEEDHALLREREEQLRAYNENLERIVEERTCQIEYQAYHDALTGLPNRLRFHDQLEKALRKVRRYGRGVAVLFVDLDNFKTVNDTQGHEAGDRLLQVVAERLQACVDGKGIVARMGGDEFTLLLEDLESVEQAQALAGDILEQLRRPIPLAQGEAYVGGSIGIAFTSNSNTRPDVLLRDADTAMYHAKTQGKGSYAVFEPRMNELLRERMEIENGLRRALEQQELRTYYQPLIDLATGQLKGMEALVRWEHPEKGMVSPGQFIPIAEETGLIVPIGYWVLEQACLFLQRWQEAHPNSTAFTMNVNLSGKQLMQEDVVKRVAQILQTTGVNPQQLKLEITESIFVADTEEILEKLKALKSLGVQLAIDDFGTGYSSLSMLNTFPIDTVKIDRSFVNRLNEPDGAAIVETIIALSRTMNLTVTAEGVETAEQVAQLQGMQCDTGQGYYFSRPLSEEQVQQRMQSEEGFAVPVATELTAEAMEALLERLLGAELPQAA
ncbi:MAG: EAL domain-containing protein [Chloroherpetonaceae bacterium]|nr:EAL domain-containing protein [Chloroherpetonaceae bacterium]